MNYLLKLDGIMFVRQTVFPFSVPISMFLCMQMNGIILYNKQNRKLILWSQCRIYDACVCNNGLTGNKTEYENLFPQQIMYTTEQQMMPKAMRKLIMLHDIQF